MPRRFRASTVRTPHPAVWIFPFAVPRPLRLSFPRLAPAYAALVGVPALALVVILRVGETVTQTQHPDFPQIAPRDTSLVSSTSATVAQSPAPAIPDLPLLLVQIIVILLAARLVGVLLRRLGQPRVVGEMLAGIARGPSLLGAHAPAVAATLFPPGSLGFLNALSQIGLLCSSRSCWRSSRGR